MLKRSQLQTNIYEASSSASFPQLAQSPLASTTCFPSWLHLVLSANSLYNVQISFLHQSTRSSVHLFWDFLFYFCHRFYQRELAGISILHMWPKKYQLCLDNSPEDIDADTEALSGNCDALPRNCGCWRQNRVQSILVELSSWRLITSRVTPSVTMFNTGSTDLRCFFCSTRIWT